MLEHEIEMTEASLSMHVGRILRGPYIPEEIRNKYAVDALIETDGHTIAWEHDRDSEDEYRIKAKMKKLADCPYDVLWTCPTVERMHVLIGLAPNDRHWFALYEEACRRPHDPVWLNNRGEYETLPKTTA